MSYPNSTLFCEKMLIKFVTDKDCMQTKLERPKLYGHETSELPLF